MRRFLLVLFVMSMIPYVTTMAWTGRLERGNSNRSEGGSLFWNQEIHSGVEAEKPRVIVGHDIEEASISVEEFLVHVLAAQMPAEFELETLKAQAILARTYIYGLLDHRTKIFEEELDMDAYSTEQMKAMWGEQKYLSMLSKIQNAIEETEGLYLLYEGSIIEPLFCYASAGKTRSLGEAFPYLKQVDSSGDLLAENYRSLPVFELQEFVQRIHEIPDAVKISESELRDGSGIQIVERDGSGYVKQVLIGQKTYNGEEIQCALGLASSCYSFEYLDGKIRVICKGIGHGYGFAQFGANEMAKEGKTYEELLNYYFQNIEIVAVKETGVII